MTIRMTTRMTTGMTIRMTTGTHWFLSFPIVIVLDDCLLHRIVSTEQTCLGTNHLHIPRRKHRIYIIGIRKGKGSMYLMLTTSRKLPKIIQTWFVCWQNLPTKKCNFRGLAINKRLVYFEVVKQTFNSKLVHPVTQLYLNENKYSISNSNGQWFDFHTNRRVKNNFNLK